MKLTTIKILRELFKNSKLSDREIARRIGISQPTVTRRRHTMVKNKIIQRYTAIPDLSKLGFEIEAYSIIPNEPSLDFDLKRDERVVFAKKVDGFNKIIVISIHKDYADYATFANKYSVDRGYSFLALASTKPVKPFSLGDIELGGNIK